MSRRTDPAGSDGDPDDGDVSEPAEVAIEERDASSRVRGTAARTDVASHGGWRLALVALTALGVVYGDLGTSAIYSLHAVFNGGDHRLALDETNVLGIISLVFWTLLIVVSLKYMLYVLRADNRGEGGVFALVGLLRPWRHLTRLPRRTLVLLGLAGASMLYAGVMITPAISILSAVEGLEVASERMHDYVVPVTLAIIVALFAVQRFGTAAVGVVFGPIMAVWFVAIAALGVYGITRAPEVVAAVNPAYAVGFFMHNGVVGFLVLFAVFLVTTGAEALYADIGHFGRGAIRWVWFAFVLPALVLNYFGQGAALLSDPRPGAQPFYHLVPDALLLPVAVLAMAATVIASQAVITGAFSMTREGSRLGMIPHLRVVQTSRMSEGQIYVPAVNGMLLVAALALVLIFRSSEALASTYGISVGTTMVVTTVLAFVVSRERWHWPLWRALAVTAGLLVVDLGFFGSNVLRIPDGGWFPIAVAVVLFTLMSTWRRGGELLAQRTHRDAKSVHDFIEELHDSTVARVPGTAVFVTASLTDTPPALTHHIRRSRALQQQVVLLTVLREGVPRTSGDERLELEPLPEGLYRLALHYGFMQGVNVPAELARCGEKGLEIDLDEVTYYVEHESPLRAHGRRQGMTGWRERLFGFLGRNSRDVTEGYQIPADRIVDLGMRVRL